MHSTLSKCGTLYREIKVLNVVSFTPIVAIRVGHHIWKYLLTFSWVLIKTEQNTPFFAKDGCAFSPTRTPKISPFVV